MVNELHNQSTNMALCIEASQLLAQSKMNGCHSNPDHLSNQGTDTELEGIVLLATV